MDITKTYWDAYEAMVVCHLYHFLPYRILYNNIHSNIISRVITCGKPGSLKSLELYCESRVTTVGLYSPNVAMSIIGEKIV